METSKKLEVQPEVLHLAGTLMEHFLEGSAPLRLWQINSVENIWVNLPMY